MGEQPAPSTPVILTHQYQAFTRYLLICYRISGHQRPQCWAVEPAKCQNGRGHLGLLAGGSRPQRAGAVDGTTHPILVRGDWWWVAQGERGPDIWCVCVVCVGRALCSREGRGKGELPHEQQPQVSIPGRETEIPLLRHDRSHTAAPLPTSVQGPPSLQKMFP